MPRRASAGEIPAAMLCRLRGEPFPADTTGPERWHAAQSDVDGASLGPMSLREAWERVGGELLAEWRERWPGTRPSGWWELDAPRCDEPGVPGWIRDRLAAPRGVRVGGEALLPSLPRGWVPSQHCGLFAPHPWTRPQYADPTIELEIEAEHVYLARHGLLTPDEALAVGDAPEIVLERVTAWAYGLDR